MAIFPAIFLGVIAFVISLFICAFIGIRPDFAFGINLLFGLVAGVVAYDHFEDW